MYVYKLLVGYKWRGWRHVLRNLNVLHEGQGRVGPGRAGPGKASKLIGDDGYTRMSCSYLEL